jgi:hypothetical protein
MFFCVSAFLSEQVSFVVYFTFQVFCHPWAEKFIIVKKEGKYASHDACIVIDISTRKTNKDSVKEKNCHSYFLFRKQ